MLSPFWSTELKSGALSLISMGFSPERPCLYRKSCQGASNLSMRCRPIWIVVVCALLVSTAFAQVAKRRAVSQGPRALGLVEVDSKGSGRLVPVVIMVDGKFYDAGIYKADPVPLA